MHVTTEINYIPSLAAGATYMDEQALQLVQRGKRCVTLAKAFYDDIVTNRTLVASTALSELHCYGRELESQAGHNAECAERAAEESKSQVERLQLEMSRLALQEQELNCRLSEIQAQLSNQQAILKDVENRHFNANADLARAKSKLREAERNRGTAVLAGAVVGFFTFGLGGAVAAAAVAGGVGHLASNVEGAENAVHRYQNECANARSAISRTQLIISPLEIQIRDILTQTAQRKEERTIFHNKVTEMKEISAFYHNLVHMARMFRMICENGIDRTELLQRLIATAEERQEYTFLQSSGTLRVAMSFMEAWEAIESYARKIHLQQVSITTGQS